MIMRRIMDFLLVVGTLMEEGSGRNVLSRRYD